MLEQREHLVFGVFWARLGPQVAFSIGAAPAAMAALGLLFVKPTIAES